MGTRPMPSDLLDLPPATDAAVQRQLLALLSGRRHQVLTAIAVIDTNGRLRTRLART